MSDHHIVWKFDRDSVYGHVVCAAPVGAICRLGPQSRDCECEQWNILRDDDSAPYHYADGGDRAVGDRHYMTDTGECQLLPWLNDPTVLTETYVGEPSTFELGRTDIEPVWHGDGYDWKRVAS